MSTIKTDAIISVSTNGNLGLSGHGTGGVKVSDYFIQTKGSDISSATSLTLGKDGNLFDVTGTTTITSIGTQGIGSIVILQFDGALTFTHHSTNLILPGGANITTAAGDIAVMYEYASADWRCVSYTKATGKAVIEYSTSASTSAAGIAELATTAETTTGTDSSRVVTLAGLHGALAGLTDTTIVAGDAIIFSDASDSNALKEDTVQGILDLAPGLATDQSWTGSQRATTVALTDGTLLDMNTAQDWDWTPAAADVLSFTNITNGQRGMILLNNPSARAITKVSAVHCDSDFLATVSAAGVYALSYWTDASGSIVYVMNSQALAT